MRKRTPRLLHFNYPSFCDFWRSSIRRIEAGVDGGLQDASRERARTLVATSTDSKVDVEVSGLLDESSRSIATEVGSAASLRTFAKASDAVFLVGALLCGAAIALFSNFVKLYNIGGRTG